MSRPTQFDALTFVDRGAGFHYIAAPPADLCDERNLASDEPWQVVLCVLERLKEGDFSHFDRLASLLRQTDDAMVWMAVELLFAHGAPWSQLATFEAELLRRVTSDAEPEVIQLFGRTLASSMDLRTVDSISALYRLADDIATRDYLEIYLSRLLEREPGPIFAGRLAFGPDVPSPFGDEADRSNVEDYLALVARTAENLAEEIRYDGRIAVIEGTIFSVRDVAEHLLDRARQGQDTERINLERMVLEANTGLSCTDFFDSEARFKPLSAAAIIEEFLDSGQAERYEPGVRYFWGHRIPD